MAKPNASLLSYLYSCVTGPYDNLHDRQLLDHFTARQEHAAFAALVRRHGGMVVQTCRRVLHNEDDAEDAFQAACLVLAQKASSIGKRESVAAWLHMVAYRVAVRARTDLARRHQHEQSGPVRVAEDPLTAITGRELLMLLDEELQRLPEPCRAPLILCYLEERTQDEASRQLGVSPRTIERRLEKGMQMLRRRLERRGLTLPAAFLTVGALSGTAKAAIPGMGAAEAIQAGMQAAVGEDIRNLVSLRAAKLAAATVKAMAMAKVVKVAACVAVLILLGTGVSVATYRQLAPAGADGPTGQKAVATRTNLGQAMPFDPPEPAVPPKDQEAKKDPPSAKATDQKEAIFPIRVVDDAGKPISGAEVTMLWVTGYVGTPAGTRLTVAWGPKNPETQKPNKVQGQTDKDGRLAAKFQEAFVAKLRVPAQTSNSGMYALAGKAGHGMTIERIAIDAPGAETKVRLPPETIVRGRVVDLQGLPAAGVEVKVVLGLGEYGSSPRIVFAAPMKQIAFWPGPVITDKEGRFTIKGVSARQRVFLSLEGGPYAVEETEIKFAETGKETVVNVSLAPASVLEGTVTAADTGKPLANVKISLGKGMLPMLKLGSAKLVGELTAETDADGHFRLQALGTLKQVWLTADPGPGPYLRYETKVPWPQGVAKHTLNFALSRGVLVRGKVTEHGTGKPVGGAVIKDSDSNGGPKIDRSVKTGPDGIFEIVVAPGKRHLFVTQVDGNFIPVQITYGDLDEQKPFGRRFYPDAVISFEAKGGTERQEVEAKLRPAVSIKGIVLRPDGTPVDKAVMICWNQERESSGLARPIIDVTEGKFELSRCDPKETYWVYFFDLKNQLGAAVQLSTKEAMSKPPTVRLEPCGKVVVRFVKENGEPVGGVMALETLVTRPKDGNVSADMVQVQMIPHRAFGVEYRVEHSDKEGKCTISALIPGAPYVFASEIRFQKPVPPFTVKSGKTLELPDIVVKAAFVPPGPAGPPKMDKKAKSETPAAKANDPKELVSAQQVSDLKYKPPIPNPAYEAGKGPQVVIDEAHHNFHTAEGRYKPFAELLRRDGYRVDAHKLPFSAVSLKGIDVLVISNALHEKNAENWAPPNPPAFTPEENAAVRTWIEKGGALLLIVDHPPFPAAAGDLAKALGVEFRNAGAKAGHWKPGELETFELATGLKDSIITRGRSKDEKVNKVATFTGSSFKPPKGATPVLLFGPNSKSLENPPVPVEGWCQGAVMELGNGRAAVFGEAGMFSAQVAGPKQRPMGMNAPGAEQNYQLVLNVLHWLTRVKGMED